MFRFWPLTSKCLPHQGMANHVIQCQRTDTKNRREYKNWFVIALSGVSCGGKTTIAKKLLKDVPASRIHLSQDEYILPNDYKGHLKAPEPLTGYNKDTLNSIDMNKMMSDINYIMRNDPADIDISSSLHFRDRKEVIGSALRSPRPPFHGFLGENSLSPVLILDGFLLLNYSDIPLLCDKMYFITLTKEECWERRKRRTFTLPGMDGENYFELCMWPKYLEYFQEMCSLVKNVSFINGSVPLKDTYEHIFKDLLGSLV